MAEVGSKRKNEEELLLSPETIIRIVEMHELLQKIEPVILEIPKMTTLMASVATGIQTISASVASMSLVHGQAEERFKRMEQRDAEKDIQLKEANDRAAGKNQVPMITHIITVVIVGLIAASTILYANQQMIEATLSSVKVKTNQ